jgi:hypothetical protein
MRAHALACLEQLMGKAMPKRTLRWESRGVLAPRVLPVWAGAVILACATVSIPIEPQPYHRTAAIAGAAATFTASTPAWAIG